MQSSLTDEKQNSKRRWFWYLYDVGNSASAAVVILAIYAANFKGHVVGGAEGSRLWGISVGIAMLVVAVISPVLGVTADHTGQKKRFLTYFTALSVGSCRPAIFLSRKVISCKEWFCLSWRKLATGAGRYFIILLQVDEKAARKQVTESTPSP
jgi:MFS-type transporter involved in bile tolerance (Atg22 family)